MDHLVQRLVRKAIPADGNPEQFRKNMEAYIAPEHNSKKHDLVIGPDGRTCVSCSWIRLDAECPHCFRDLREHIRAVLTATRSLGHITEGAVKQAMQAEAEDGIIAILHFDQYPRENSYLN